MPIGCSPISSAVVIFVDSNVPMYLVGAPHPNREQVEAFLRSQPDEDYVTSAEVYQEILHRYVAIDRRTAIDDAFRLLDDLVDSSVFSISRSDVEAAREIAFRIPELSSRACLHLAVMRTNGVRRALTFDQGFSAPLGITRLP